MVVPKHLPRRIDIKHALDDLDYETFASHGSTNNNIKVALIPAPPSKTLAAPLPPPPVADGSVVVTISGSSAVTFKYQSSTNKTQSTSKSRANYKKTRAARPARKRRALWVSLEDVPLGEFYKALASTSSGWGNEERCSVDSRVLLLDIEACCGERPAEKAGVAAPTAEVAPAAGAEGGCSSTSTPRPSSSDSITSKTFKKGLVKVAQLPQQVGKALVEAGRDVAQALDVVVEAVVGAGRDVAQAVDRAASGLRRRSSSFNGKMVAGWNDFKGEVKEQTTQVTKTTKGLYKFVKKSVKGLKGLAVCGSDSMPVEPVAV